MTRDRLGMRRGHRRLSRRTQGIVAALAVAVGIVGIVATGGRDRGVAEVFLDIDDGRWAFTFVATDDAGVGALAADGVLDLRDGRCATAGRVLVGELVVNPASDPTDVHRILDDAEAGTGVGRIVSVERDGVHLPDGSFSGGMPLGALGTLRDVSLCTAVVRVVRDLRERDGLAIAEVDALVDGDDAARGRQRLRLGLDEQDGTYRYEPYRDGDGGRGIVVRRADPAAAVAVIGLHLTALDPVDPPTTAP